jgi:predicted transcriptional regulator
VKKKSIFEKKMEKPGFKKMYEAIEQDMLIGEEIAKLRHEQHMTQAVLARKARTSRPAIARYESGAYTRYNLQTLRRIAGAFGKHVKVSFV